MGDIQNLKLVIQKLKLVIQEFVIAVSDNSQFVIQNS